MCNRDESNKFQGTLYSCRFLQRPDSLNAMVPFYETLHGSSPEYFGSQSTIPIQLTVRQSLLRKLRVGERKETKRPKPSFIVWFVPSTTGLLEVYTQTISKLSCTSENCSEITSAWQTLTAAASNCGQTNDCINDGSCQPSFTSKQVQSPSAFRMEQSGFRSAPMLCSFYHRHVFGKDAPSKKSTSMQANSPCM